MSCHISPFFTKCSVYSKLCLLYICLIYSFFFVDTLSMLSSIESGQMTIHSSLTLQSHTRGKTVKYIDHSDNSSWHVFAFNTYRTGRLIPDWLVENMNPDMTLNRIC